MTDLLVTDVIIAGAGLVGSAFALGLARAHPKLKIVLIDPQTLRQVNQVSPTEFDSRVVALNAESVTLLQHLEVWEAICNLRVCEYRAMTVWDGEGTAKITFNAAEVHQRNLGYIVENSVALGVLHQALSAHSNIEVLYGALGQWRVMPDKRVEVTLTSGETLNAKLLIGADGAGSEVRRLGDFKTREWSYGQSAIVTTVQTERAHEFTAWQRFTDDGPLAFLPLFSGEKDNEQGHYCSIVWSMNEPAVARVAALEDVAFCVALGTAFELTLGKVFWTDKRKVIPLKQIHAVNYCQQSVALIGDAAHTIHPLAGQGVNVGLRDVSVLLEEIHRARARNISLCELSTLQRFERRVQTHNLLAMGAMEGFKRLFAQGSPWVRVARNWGMQQVSDRPFIKRQFMRLAMGRGV